MNSGSSTLSKTIKNSTDSGRLINIHLERLSSPLDGGQVIPMDKPDEVLLTPASLLLPAQASDVIRFFYKGPADDKERYYRIVWFDQALSDYYLMPGKSRRFTRVDTADKKGRVALWQGEQFVPVK